MKIEGASSAPSIPWGPIGYLVYKRTYARHLVDGDKTSPVEEFHQTVERVLEACDRQLGVNFTPEEKEHARGVFLGLKASVAGRFLWQLGTRTVDRLGLLSLQNCAFVVVNRPVTPFTWSFDALMLGAGVGFNIQRKHVFEIEERVRRVEVTRQDTPDADFIVPDSREGWVELLRRTLEAHFYNGRSFTYSTICIRSKGAPIKSFGGTASGPEDLCWGISEINRVLNQRAGKKLRPIDALDLMNILGSVVVSGNVRRSAQIAIGDADDVDFLNAKRWDLGSVPNWRAMSNNSVVCNDFSRLPEEFWQGYLGHGEPYGLVNLRLSRLVGRTGDTRYPDPEIEGFNPCAEQSLANHETCALGEIFLPRIATKEELMKIARMLYRLVKHSLRLPCHQKETERIVHKNMRMGLGISGYLQASEEQKSWLPDVYEDLRRFDEQYSASKGWPPSIKITTVKPSGTLSLLPGVTPGVHPGFSHYHIRRVRMASNLPLVDLCRAHGFPVEWQIGFDGLEDRSTNVVGFPCSFPENTVVAEQVSAIQQLEYVARLQRDWSDNAVSCTVYYRREELADIRNWLAENYNTGIKSVSFLLHSGHGFRQAPLEQITREEYEDLVGKTTPITSMSTFSYTGEEEQTPQDSLECSTGACPVR